MKIVTISLGSVLLSVCMASAAETPKAAVSPIKPASSLLPLKHPASLPAEAAKKEETSAPEVKAENTEKQTGFLVRPGMARISSGENVGTNLDKDIGSYKIRNLQPFHMDVTEVTLKQWKEVRDWAVKRPDIAEAERSYFAYDFDNTAMGKGDDYPVTMVTWFECLKWCNARSEKEGLIPCYSIGGVILRNKADSIPDCNFAASGYRLPTVQEWDYAARGGLIGKRFPWGDNISHDDANYYSAVNMKDDTGKIYDNSKTRGCHPKFAVTPFPYTAPVKSFPANDYGLFDMAGNVSEWCWAPKGASRMTCGGSWDSDARGLRNSIHSVHDGPGDRDDTIGFRTVRTAGQ